MRRACGIVAAFRPPLTHGATHTLPHRPAQQVSGLSWRS